MSPEYHAWTHRPKAQGGTDPIEVSSGLSFCYAQTSTVNIDDGGGTTGSQVANYGTGTTFKKNDSAIFPSVYHDTGKTPEYGIRIPANKLVLVNNWVWINSGVANGTHTIGWVIDGSYSVSHFGIADNSDFTSSAATTLGLADTRAAPEALYHVAYMGDTADFTVGTYHFWKNWTNGPLDFQYGINVTVIGDLPT